MTEKASGALTDRHIVRVIVRGRVQGVGFRAFVEDEAHLRSLDGWVRNRRDGSVEAVLAGQTGPVELMLDDLRRGPPASRVDAVDVTETDETALSGVTGFQVLPTV